MLTLMFARSCNDNVKENKEEYCRPSTYVDAIKCVHSTIESSLPIVHKRVIDDDEQDEGFVDLFADYHGESFADFYNEYEEFLVEHGLFTFAKSFELLDIVYECIEIIEREDNQCTDDSEEDIDYEYYDLFDNY